MNGKNLTSHSPTTPVTFSSRFRNFMKGHYFELGVCIAMVIIMGIFASRLTFDMDGYSDEVGQVMFGTCILFGVASIVLVRAFMGWSLKEAKDERTKKTKKSKVDIIKGFFFIWFMPLVALLIYTPWLVAGVFNDDSVGTVASYFMLALVFFGSLLLGILVLAFIVAPIEIFLRGVWKLMKGDRTGLPLIIFGIAVGLITTFIFVGAGAISADYPGLAAGPGIISALLGIPGAYDIKNETLLWIARGMALFFVIVIIFASLSGKKSKDTVVAKDGIIKR